ncbi:MAG TPA: NAD(P)(+) transhydrogenase (Re/Si-specific) subunit alpha, partial [Candidatus Omnitrophota bacterium]|nr:NAD(P)(+) transhydrogenase (Re/Si-specific) subunit alpha [Candidatus Omnitrophota bacterium]
VFGRKAPRIITKNMIMGMRPGSVIVDMAVETGGNVEGSLVDQDVELNGVLILGLSNLPGKVAADASSMFSNNITSLILHYWDKASKSLKFSQEDEILKGCLLASQGKILNEKFQHLQKA